MTCSIVTDVLLFMTVLYRHFTKQMIRHSAKILISSFVYFLCAFTSSFSDSTCQSNSYHMCVKQIIRENSARAAELFEL